MATENEAAENEKNAAAEADKIIKKAKGAAMGYRIRELREAMKMTQEELADKSGVSRGTISALENGSMRNTTSKTLLKLAQALNTSVDRIFFTETV